MLSRMKKMLRNEKGFTLVELLAVIVILGIIVAIAVPAIGNITSGAKEDAKLAQQELILDAARLADVEGAFKEGITVAELVTAGYLEGSDKLPSGSVSSVAATNKYEFTETAAPSGT